MSLKELELYGEGKENSIKNLRKVKTQSHLCFRRWTSDNEGLNSEGSRLQTGKQVAMILEPKDGVSEVNGIFESMRPVCDLATK